jgi:hypothetical protein
VAFNLSCVGQNSEHFQTEITDETLGGFFFSSHGQGHYIVKKFNRESLMKVFFCIFIRRKGYNPDLFTHSGPIGSVKALRGGGGGGALKC